MRVARNNRFRRSAVIHRAADGGLKHFHDGLGSRERALFAIAVAFAAAVLELRKAGMTHVRLPMPAEPIMPRFSARWRATLKKN